MSETNGKSRPKNHVLSWQQVLILGKWLDDNYDGLVKRLMSRDEIAAKVKKDLKFTVTKEQIGNFIIKTGRSMPRPRGMRCVPKPQAAKKAGANGQTPHDVNAIVVVRKIAELRRDMAFLANAVLQLQQEWQIGVSGNMLRLANGEPTTTEEESAPVERKNPFNGLAALAAAPSVNA